jgi:mannitol-1-phosphate/altronate dehydrogenase
MLNASHSMLSYPGLLGGYCFVHEAMADARITGYLRAFLDRDVIPLLAAPPGMPLATYRDTVLTRFANPAINDQLARITSDGASKIPVFLGDTIRAALDRGTGHERLAFLLAAYARYLSGIDDRGAAFTPQEPRLSEADRRLAAAPEPEAFLRAGPFAGLALDRSLVFLTSFARCRALIAERGALPALAAILGQGGG